MSLSAHGLRSFFFVTLLASCGGPSTVTLRNPGPVLVTAGGDSGSVRAAIIRALEARRFVPESDENGAITARFTRGSQTFRIQLAYNAEQFQIQYVDSANYGYGADELGNPVIDSSYDAYTTRLSSAIQSELGRPAREAEAAVRAEREAAEDEADDARRDQRRAERREMWREQEERNAAFREAEAQRQADLERERLHTQRVQAEADARRPIIVGAAPTMIGSLAYERAPAARFGNIRVNLNAQRPLVARGNAGGGHGTLEMQFPAGCVGYFSGRAEHILALPSDANYLRVEASSTADLTLAILAPDGSVWCDDDGAGAMNPLLEGMFPAGYYQIFVGRYEPGPNANYELTISTAAPMQQHQVQQPQAAPATCQQVLLERGWHSAHLIHCDGVDQACAVALLRSGQNPAHLVHCR